MAKTIIVLDYEKVRVVKIELSKMDEFTVTHKFDSNYEEWLSVNYEDEFDFNEIHWMVVDEVVENTVKRDDSAYCIGELAIDLGLPLNNCWGLKATNGEYMLTLKFFDGYAIEVDENWLEVHVEKDPVTMFYPTLAEVNGSTKLQHKIREYTGREWDPDAMCVYDIALTFGQIRRRKKYVD